MTNEKRIEVLKRLVEEEEDQIRFLERDLFHEVSDTSPTLETCRDNIAAYTRIITKLRQRS